MSPDIWVKQQLFLTIYIEKYQNRMKLHLSVLYIQKTNKLNKMFTDRV